MGLQSDDSHAARSNGTRLVLAEFAGMTALRTPEARRDWILSLNPQTYNAFLVRLNGLARGISNPVDEGVGSHTSTLSSPPREMDLRLQARSLHAAQRVLSSESTPLQQRLKHAALLMSSTQVLVHVHPNGNGRLSRLFGYAVANGYSGMAQAKKNISTMIEHSEAEQPFRPQIPKEARRAVYREVANKAFATIATDDIPHTLWDGPVDALGPGLFADTGLRNDQAEEIAMIVGDSEPIGRAAVAHVLNKRQLLTPAIFENISSQNEEPFRVLNIVEAVKLLGPEGVDDVIKTRGLMATHAVSTFIDEMETPTKAFQFRCESKSILDMVDSAATAASTIFNAKPSLSSLSDSIRLGRQLT